MMGMMTMVRVLPEREYQEIQSRVRERDGKAANEHEHHS